MRTVKEAITGKENQGDLTSPYQALVQFYYAFNSGEMQMMSENWAQSGDIAMDNPLGDIKRGCADQSMSAFSTGLRKTPSSISTTASTRHRRYFMQ